MEITGTLSIQNRENTSSKANNRLRRDGYLPGNVYAKGMESVAVTVKKDELRKNLAKFGRSALFKLKDEKGKVYNVMVKDIQNTPVTGEYMHVDFQQVSLKEEVRANVPLKIEGKELLESRRLLMMRHLDQIHVKGLPQDIPNTIDIDVSGFQGGENITVGDLTFPAGILPDMDTALLVITVSESRGQEIRAEEEEAAAPAAGGEAEAEAKE